MSGINPKIIEALMETQLEDTRILEFINKVLRKEAINLETKTGQKSSKKYYKDIIDEFFGKDVEGNNNVH